MPKRTKHKGSGKYSARARVGDVELALSGKTSTISVHRSDAEQQRLLDRIKVWRAGAVDVGALSILGNVYYAQNVFDPETYAEWSHEGLGPKVEHIALLLAARPANGDNALVPADVIKKINAYLEELFQQLQMYYDEVDGTRHPLEPDVRGLVLRDELFVRMPVYPRQHRKTLLGLFGPVEREMEASLGFRIEDAIAVDEAFEQIAVEAAGRCSMALSVSIRPLAPFAKKTPNGAIIDFGGDAETEARIREEIRMARASAMATFGAEIAVDSGTVAARVGIEHSRAEAVLRFFETTSADVDSDYFVHAPDSPLKRKPFLRFDGRWVLPNQMLFLSAMQPALERALNPAHGAAPASVATWTKYIDGRADALERWTADAVSSLLGGAVIHRNLKYKSVVGSKAHDELDAMALVDGKMLLVESKAGGFTATARRGDVDAIEGNIERLMTDAHEQALRAAVYVRSRPDPVFRENGREIRVDMSKVDEVLLVTTTLEDLWAPHSALQRRGAHPGVHRRGYALGRFDPRPTAHREVHAERADVPPLSQAPDRAERSAGVRRDERIGLVRPIPARCVESDGVPKTARLGQSHDGEPTIAYDGVRRLRTLRDRPTQDASIPSGTGDQPRGGPVGSGGRRLGWHGIHGCWMPIARPSAEASARLRKADRCRGQADRTRRRRAGDRPNA